jgi:hypothetical protein
VLPGKAKESSKNSDFNNIPTLSCFKGFDEIILHQLKELVNNIKHLKLLVTVWNSEL